MRTMPAQTTAAGPKRRARRGAMTPKRAKHSGGTEVSSPATLPLMPSPSRTSSRRAPRLVMAGRRFSAASTMPTANRRVVHARVDAFPVCSPVCSPVCLPVRSPVRAGESLAAELPTLPLTFVVDFSVRVSSLAMPPIIE